MQHAIPSARPNMFRKEKTLFLRRLRKAVLKYENSIASKFEIDLN
jgi:hypothetical protein